MTERECVGYPTRTQSLGASAVSSGTRAASDQALGHAAAAVGLVSVLLGCVQWHPIEAATSYYEYRLHDAVAVGAQFGTDAVATYGPLGFVGLSVLHPRTFAWAMLVNCCVYALTFWQLTVFFRLRLRAHPAWPALCAAAVLLTQACLPQKEWSPLLYLIYVWAILETNTLANPSRVFTWLSPVVWGLFSLVKVSSWPLTVVLALVCTAAAPSWRLRAQWWTCYGACFALGWLATGQHFAGIPEFISNSLEVARGYRYAMSIAGSAPYVVHASLAGTGALAVVVAGRTAWRRQRGLRRLLAPFGWALCSAHLYQTAFVRSDGGHIVSNMVALVALLPLLAAVVTRRVRDCWLVLAAASVGAWLVIHASSLDEPLFARPWRQAQGAVQLLTRGMQPMLQVRENSLEALARRFALRGLRSIDVPTGDPGLAAANGIELMQAPGLFSYGHYTPILARLHQALLERADGPEAVIMCTRGSVDDRMPTEVDARLYPALWTHFEAQPMLDGCALWKRIAAAPKRIDPLPPFTLAMHEKRELPKHKGDALWVKATFRSTLKGKLVNAALKPTAIYVEVWLDGGASRVYQLNPLMTADGFLLSPILDSPHALARFYAKGRGDRVSALRFLDHGEGGYEPLVEVELSIVRLTSQP